MQARLTLRRVNSRLHRPGSRSVQLALRWKSSGNRKLAVARPIISQNTRCWIHRPPFQSPIVSKFVRQFFTSTSSAVAIWRFREPIAPAEGMYRYLNCYKYAKINDAQKLRLELYKLLYPKRVFGRIYVANEGINAQLFVPCSYTTQTLYEELMKLIPDLCLSDLRNGFEMEPDKAGAPFKELVIRVKKSIVADELQTDIELDMKNTGAGLPPEEWHNQLKQVPNKVLLDCRNYWESDIGRFKDATQLEVDRFSETWNAVDTHLANVEPTTPIYIYCTGGIRCEKVGAYLVQKKGFKNVNRLEGGINAYIEFLRRNGIESEESLFKGKNYVFDDRNLEGDNQQVTNDVLATCHSCGAKCDTIRNCKNKNCNILYIHCPSCAEKFQGYCSHECAHSQEQTHKDMGRAPRYVGLLRKKAAGGSFFTAPPVGQHSAPTGTGSVLFHTRSIAKNNTGVISEALDWYVSEHSSTHSPILAQLAAETEQLYPQVAHQIIGPVQGKFMQLLLRFMNARRVLEIGTFTGYSALTFAEALPSDGLVVTVERNAELRPIVEKYLKLHPDGYKINFVLANAVDFLQQLSNDSTLEPFDVVFIDADKRNYITYYNIITNSGILAKNGALMVDNTLWKGKVTNEETDKHTTLIRSFNDHVRMDNRVEKIILPLRDGLTLIRKK